MKKKVCFITGGNSGIGKAAAIQIAAAGLYVIIGARNKERGEKALAEIREKSGSEDVDLVIIDMASRSSIVEASNLLRDKVEQLDVLIHNAADFDLRRKRAEKTVDGIEKVWATNHLGPILLTKQLMGLLRNSEQGRIITVASKGLIMHPRLKVDLDDPEFRNRKFSVPKAYYQSKLAQIMYTYWLAKQLHSEVITVNCVRVTNVKIDIDRYPDIHPILKFMYSIKSRFAISPAEMAETYTYLATSPEVSEVTGKYYDEKKRQVKSSRYSMKWENIEAVMGIVT